MGALAILKPVVDGLTANRRQVLRWVLRRLALGEPVTYAGAGQVWYVWVDHRLDLEMVAVVGAVTAAFTDIPAGYDPNTRTRAQVEADVRGFVAARLNPPVTDVPDPWQATLTAQGAPAAVKAGSSVPAGWTPVVPLLP